MPVSATVVAPALHSNFIDSFYSLDQTLLRYHLPLYAYIGWMVVWHTRHAWRCKKRKIRIRSALRQSVIAALSAHVENIILAYLVGWQLSRSAAAYRIDDLDGAWMCDALALLLIVLPATQPVSRFVWRSMLRSRPVLSASNG